jgi:O-succinylbenzoate synthase
MHTLGAGRIINIKPGRVGGFGPSIAIHDYCQEHGTPVWCGGMFESGVGRAYKRRARVAPELHEAGRCLPERALLGARRGDAGVDDGQVGHGARSARHAGIGVSVDMDRVENLTVRTGNRQLVVTPPAVHAPTRSARLFTEADVSCSSD